MKFHYSLDRKLLFWNWFINYIFLFSHFQDLRANEARLQELNSIADRLTAMGQTEAAEKIREQIAVSFGDNKLGWYAISVLPYN